MPGNLECQYSFAPKLSDESGFENCYSVLQTWSMSLHTYIGTLIGLLLAIGFAAAETGDLTHPDWHPDGKLLVAEGSCADSIDLYLIDVEESEHRHLFAG